MDVEVNFLAVFLAAVANMIIGGIWYAPQLFGSKWQKEVGLKDKDMKEGAPMAMLGAFVLAILAAYILAHVTYISASFFDQSFSSAAISTAFWLWLGVGLTTLVTQGFFERRSVQWMAIVSGNLIVAFVVMGLVIGQMGV